MYKVSIVFSEPLQRRPSRPRNYRNYRNHHLAWASRTTRTTRTSRTTHSRPAPSPTALDRGLEPWNAVSNHDVDQLRRASDHLRRRTSGQHLDDTLRSKSKFHCFSLCHAVRDAQPLPDLTVDLDHHCRPLDL